LVEYQEELVQRIDEEVEETDESLKNAQDYLSLFYY